MVAKACLAQFDNVEALHHLWPMVRSEGHLDRVLDDVERRYPAKRYVMVDDKVRILAAMKETWGDRLTTVFVRQGHYALDASLVAASPPADVTVEAIGDLIELADSL